VLILTRRAGEKLVIDGDIVLTVLEVGRGGQVRIGIDAPRTHRILRGELLDEISAENRGAAVRPDATPDLGSILGNLPAKPQGSDKA
jgi:carbon storage regulator